MATWTATLVRDQDLKACVEKGGGGSAQRGDGGGGAEPPGRMGDQGRGPGKPREGTAPSPADPRGAGATSEGDHVRTSRRAPTYREDAWP